MTKKKKGKDRWTMLAEAAKELNETLGLEPAIETTDVSEIELEEKLEEAAALIAPEDEFTEQTEYILSEFLEGEETEEVDDGWDDEESEEAETEEEEAEEYTLEEIREFVETTDKRKDLRIFAMEFEDVFSDSIEKMNDKGLRSAKALKGSMLSELDEIEAEDTEEAEEVEEYKPEVEEPDDSPTQEQEEPAQSESEGADTGKKDQGPKKTRAQVFAEIFENDLPLTKKQIEARMLERYRSDSESGAKRFTSFYVGLLKELGFLQEADDGTLEKTV